MKRGWFSGIAVALALLVAGLLAQPSGRELEATSFGRTPSGYGALYDLLAESGLAVSRSYAAPHTLPADATVWWIAPRGLCAAGFDGSAGAGLETAGGEGPRGEGNYGVDGEEGEGASAQELDPGAGLLAFAAAGGRAVLFLDWTPCRRLSDVALPERGAAPWLEEGPKVRCGDSAAEGGVVEAESCPETPEKTPQTPNWERLERFFSSETQRVAGSLLGAQTLLLEGRPAITFAEEPPREGPWQSAATLGGWPFLLERRYGAGRLVLVADSFFVENRALARGDAAPLVGALVRAYGVPRLDERQHGLRLAQGSLSYLLSSAALPAFAGFGLLGLLYIWWGRAPRLVPPAAPQIPAPSLEDFVGSLARLYGRGGDPDSTAERYRLVSLARLRRHFGLGFEVADEVLLARLAQRGAPAARRLAVLGQRPVVGSRRGLARAVRALDDAVEEFCR